MSSISEFVSAAQQAEPSLGGQDDKSKAEIEKLSSQAEGLSKDIPALNEKLVPLTYLYSNSPSLADVNLYCHLHPTMASSPSSQHPTAPAVLRYFLHIQSLPPVLSAQKSLPNSFPPIDVDVSTLAIPERKVVVPPKKEKKEKKDASAASGSSAGPAAKVSEAVAGVGAAVSGALAAAAEAVVGSTDQGKEAKSKEGKDKGKKEKKEKAPKAPTPKPEPVGPSPSMIDLRVGKVLDVKKHPDADSLYVESIDVGEPEPRTVCSGLVKYMPESDIQGATVIVICNLKPVTMRGVKSFAMLLCASSKSADGEERGVEFVLPPEGSVAGERVYFEGDKYENEKPEEMLNPKKKVFETIQPGFTTLDNRDAAWIDPESKSVHRIRTKDGVCKSKSFIGASLS